MGQLTRGRVRDGRISAGEFAFARGGLEDRELIVGVRPESLRPAVDGMPALDVHVSVVEPMGDEVIIPGSVAAELANRAPEDGEPLLLNGDGDGAGGRAAVVARLAPRARPAEGSVIRPGADPAKGPSVRCRVRRGDPVRWSRTVPLIALSAVIACLAGPALAGARGYKRPPVGPSQWYWEIGPPAPGFAGLPANRAPYPKPGSAPIWDTDLFQDSNRPAAGIPTGRSPVVSALHRSGKYSICYVEVGAYQTGFPDDGNFAAADYGHAAHRYGMQGYPNEWWFDIAGFRDYVAGRPSTLRGAAVDIAAALDKRFGWCRLEGQDAVEPDDLDGYTNRSDTGVPGGGWHLTRAESAGFERWLAYDAHAHGLAVFQKNDPANAAVNVEHFDGMIIEECNHYRDPCAGPGGDATPYLRAGKPVLNAEYTQDGETTAKFCAADLAAGITGALFDVDLGGKTYRPCAPAGRAGR